MSNPEKLSGGLLPEADSTFSEFPPPPPGPPPQQVYGYESAQSSYPGQPQYQKHSTHQEEKKRLQDQQQHQQQHHPPHLEPPRVAEEAKQFSPPPELSQKLPHHQEQQFSPPPEVPQKQHHQQQEKFPSPPELPHQQKQEKQQYPPPSELPHHQHFPQDKKQQHQDQQQSHHFPPPPPLPHQQQQAQSPHSPTQPQQTYSIPAYNPADPVFAPPPTEPLSHQPSQPDHHYQDQQASPSADIHHGDSSPHGRPKNSWGERFSQLSIKVASPINSLAHKLGSQSFLPETMDKECDKAAAILKDFCKKGIYADPNASDVNVPSSTSGHPPKPHQKEDLDYGKVDQATIKPKSRVLVTIPPKVISKAVGLAIFTTLRAGYGVSGATGSGILVARLPNGSWSPPSGIQLHSLGGGFQIGVDIYDCVCVINSEKALEAFMDTRVSLGSDMAVVAGPYGAGAAVDFAVPESKAAKKGDATSPAGTPVGAKDEPPALRKQNEQQQQNLRPPNDGEADRSKKGSHRRGLSGGIPKPVFSYVKSRGFYAGIRVDGTVVAERKDANASFYGQSISVQKILRGQVPHQGPSGMWPAGAQNFFAVLKGAEAVVQTGATSSSGLGNGPSDFYSRDQDETGAPPPAYQDDGHHAVMQDVKYR